MAKSKKAPAPGFAAAAKSHLSDKQAKVYGRLLRQLEKRHGSLSPSLVLRAAQSKRSPLHDYFEWDDSVAAQSYRLQQASQLIRTIRIRYVDPQSKEPELTRAFVPVTMQRGAGDDAKPQRAYVSLSRALADEDWLLEVIAAARADYLATQQRYRRYMRHSEFRRQMLTVLRKLLDEYDEDH